MGGYPRGTTGDQGLDYQVSEELTTIPKYEIRQLRTGKCPLDGFRLLLVQRQKFYYELQKNGGQ